MIVKKKSEELKLREAIQLYQNEERSPANSYDWYRKSAQWYGKISIGNTNVPVHKKKGSWYIGGQKFAEALKHHRDAINHLKQITADYAKGIIHGKDGEVINTEWGGYKIRGDFRFAWSDNERYRQRSSGTWYCNRCNILAKTEHNKEECHLCSDWNGCGIDCTISRVYCPKCNKSLAL